MTDQFATYPSLRGQVAFVSGGATGLGAEFVTQLAAQGVSVGFADLQDDAGQALASTTRRRSTSTATSATSPRFRRLLPRWRSGSAP